MTLTETTRSPLGPPAEGADRATMDAASLPDPRGRRRRMAAILVVAVLALVALTVFVLRTDRGGDTQVGDLTMPTSAAIEDTYGIRFIGAYLTAAGGMVQLQYQVLDGDKAVGAHVEGVAPRIIEDGVVFDNSGLAGHGHKAKMVAGRTSSLLISNTGSGLQVGDTITIRVGDLELDGVTLG